MKYSLSNYILSIEPTDASLKTMFGTISIGGEGDYLDSISFSHDETLWQTESFATGAWVHNKNLSKKGSASMSLNQVSDKVSKIKSLCSAYFNGDYNGCTLSLTDLNGNEVVSAIDCYISKIPEQTFGNTAAMQTWSFTCGQINFA